nr:Serine/threonine-protein kinase Nek8 [Polyrhizophydium stewartii]
MEQWSQFVKVKVVGRGAHGMAILCRRKQDNSPVVVKELFTSSMSEDEKQHSLNEIKVLTILRHPNIIAYYDSFTGTGMMEFEIMGITSGGTVVGSNGGGGAGAGGAGGSGGAGVASPGVGGSGDLDNSQNRPGANRRSSDKKKVVVSEGGGRASLKKEKLPSTLMIVMEYADGGTLSDYLDELAAEKQLLPLEDIMNLFCQIALALNHIHSHKILHRDLKTNNILISGTGKYKVLKIGDFGISKIMSAETKAETVVGTPAYISPELCEGKPYNEKSDIWALGCVLYEIICLKKMFSAHNLPALVLKILRGTYDPLPSQYPAKLAELVQSCVELEPSNRPFMPDIIGKPFLQEHLVRTIFGVGQIETQAKAGPIAGQPAAGAAPPMSPAAALAGGVTG